MNAPDQPLLASIRTARAGDAAGIAHVHVESWQDAYAGLLPDRHLLRLNAEAQAIGWTRNLMRPEIAARTLVAEIEGEIVGFANFGAAREGRGAEEGGVFMLYVATDWREQGIGRQLVLAAFDALRRQRYAAASIWCLAENAPAIGFYQRLGGQRISAGRLENVGGKMFEVVGFRWALASG